MMTGQARISKGLIEGTGPESNGKILGGGKASLIKWAELGGPNEYGR